MAPELLLLHYLASYWFRPLVLTGHTVSCNLKLSIVDTVHNLPNFLHHLFMEPKDPPMKSGVRKSGCQKQ